MTPIKAFADQDGARVAITNAAAASAAELILMMDMVTSGGDGLGALQDAAGNDSADYFEFRDFFAPHIASALCAFAGNVLHGCKVDPEGRVHLDLKARTAAPDRLVAFCGRLEWLLGEIESLQEHFEQLYPADVVEFEAIVEKLDACDLADPIGLLNANEVWPRLEIIYRWAQPGGRIYRGDEEAIAKAQDVLDEYGRRFKIAEAEAVKRKRLAVGDEEPQTDEELEAALEECERIKDAAIQRRNQLQRSAVDADNEVRALTERLTALAMKASA